MERAIDAAVPDLKNRPTTPGLLAFFAYDKPLEDEDAVKIIDELKAGGTDIGGLKIGMIKSVRHILVWERWEDHLPYGSIASFLQSCHERIPSGSSASAIMEEVSSILDALA